MKFPTFSARRLCVLCKQHNAKFIFRGRVKRDREHDLCSACFKSWRDRNAAHQLRTGSSSRTAFSFETSSYFFRQSLEQRSSWRVNPAPRPADSLTGRANALPDDVP